MATYNLSDNVSKSFSFTVDGLVFEFRRPIVSELRDNQSLQEEMEKAKTDKEKAAIGEKMSDFIYSMVTPVDHTESIKDVLDRQPVNILQAFNKMVETELAVS